MKKQVKNKYLEKYKTTSDVSSSIKRDPNKIPGYHSSGRIEYVRHLPPIRDEKIIDVQILKEVCPGIDFDKIVIEYGICTANKIRFRFKNVIELIKEFRELGLIADVRIDSIYNQYNTKYHDNKNEY
jgi:hypothetical protein